MARKIMPLPLAAVLLGAAGVAWAQAAAEPLPPEHVKMFAPLAIALIQEQFPEPPVKVEPQPELTQGYHVRQEIGVVMIPDKNLTAEAVEQAGEKEVPVGILATKSLSLEDRDAVIGEDRIAVANFNDLLKIPVFYLTTKGAGDARSLEVYSKTGKPLVSVPLKKVEKNGDAALSFKLTNIDVEKKKLDVNLNVGGTYEGTVRMAHLPI